jgi:hypothetical protein
VPPKRRKQPERYMQYGLNWLGKIKNLLKNVLTNKKNINKIKKLNEYGLEE